MLKDVLNRTKKLEKRSNFAFDPDASSREGSTFSPRSIKEPGSPDLAHLNAPTRDRKLTVHGPGCAVPVSASKLNSPAIKLQDLSANQIVTPKN